MGYFDGMENQRELEICFKTLVSAFISLSEDLLGQDELEMEILEQEKHEIKEDSSAYNDPLQTSLLSAVRSESKRNKSKTLKT